MRNKYGLYPFIKVTLHEDRMGNVVIRPVSRNVRRRVAESNQYDKSSDIFIQEARTDEWKSLLPKKAFCNRGTEWNDGAVFMMDSWEFRHMVGGQSD